MTVTVLLMANSVYAIRIFDGNRKGITLEGNIGVGMTTVFSDYLVKEQVTRGAFNFEAKFGYGGSNQYQLYIINKIAVIDFPKMIDDYGNYFDKMSGEGIVAAFYILASPFVLPFIPYASSHSLLGFGGDYYFSDTVPSYFVGVGFGGSVMYNPFREKTDGGAGFFISGGYEFRKHRQVKFDIMYGFTTEEKSDSYYDPYDPEPVPKTKALSILFTFGFHEY
jgi:hypothetical protein